MLHLCNGSTKGFHLSKKNFELLPYSIRGFWSSFSKMLPSEKKNLGQKSEHGTQVRMGQKDTRFYRPSSEVITETEI